MHLILGCIAVIIVWGIGMIVRPAATIFLTTLVAGFLYLIITNAHNIMSGPDPIDAVHFDEKTNTYVDRSGAATCRSTPPPPDEDIMDTLFKPPLC